MVFIILRKIINIINEEALHTDIITGSLKKINSLKFLWIFSEFNVLEAPTEW